MQTPSERKGVPAGMARNDKLHTLDCLRVQLQALLMQQEGHSNARVAETALIAAQKYML